MGADGCLFTDSMCYELTVMGELYTNHMIYVTYKRKCTGLLLPVEGDRSLKHLGKTKEVYNIWRKLSISHHNYCNLLGCHMTPLKSVVFVHGH